MVSVYPIRADISVTMSPNTRAGAYSVPEVVFYVRNCRHFPHPALPAGRPRPDHRLDAAAGPGRGRGLPFGAPGRGQPVRHPLPYPPGGHRPGGRGPADVIPRPKPPLRHCLQRGTVQYRRGPGAAYFPRPPLPDPDRHRSRPPQLYRMGRALPPPLQRHLRLRRLGQSAEVPLCCPGPDGGQTLLLPVGGREFPLRVGVKDAAGLPRRQGAA